MRRMCDVFVQQHLCAAGWCCTVVAEHNASGAGPKRTTWRASLAAQFAVRPEREKSIKSNGMHSAGICLYIYYSSGPETGSAQRAVAAALRSVRGGLCVAVSREQKCLCCGASTASPLKVLNSRLKSIVPSMNAICINDYFPKYSYPPGEWTLNF